MWCSVQVHLVHWCRGAVAVGKQPSKLAIRDCVSWWLIHRIWTAFAWFCSVHNIFFLSLSLDLPTLLSSGTSFLFSWYSMYKSAFGMLFVVVVDRRGFIRFVSDGYQPIRAELDILFASFRQQHNRPFYLPAGTKGMGDIAYAARPHLFLAPYSRNLLCDSPLVSKFQKWNFNFRLRSFRVLSEHVFAHVLNKWTLRRGKMRIEKSTIPLLLNCACLLSNFIFKRSGIFPHGINFDPNEYPFQDDDQLY